MGLKYPPRSTRLWSQSILGVISTLDTQRHPGVTVSLVGASPVGNDVPPVVMGEADPPYSAIGSS